LRRVRGFTLLELLAVVLIIGLVAGLAIPNIGILGDRSLEDGADALAADLEWARQRAMLLGVRHRLVLDLDAGLYWCEWEPPADAEPEVAPAAAPGSAPQVAFTPPASALRRFEPVPDRSGGVSALGEEIFFTGVETGLRRIEQGLVTLTFESDGSTEAVRVFLARPGERELVLEVQPLLETVRVLDAAA
jgi:prepilin-type N-terminal cleavage/methylation domain-containing protein